MSLKYDPEWFAVAGPIVEATKRIPPLPVHDVEARRQRSRISYAAWARFHEAAVAASAAAASTDPNSVPLEPKPSITHTTHTVTAHDGHSLTLHQFGPPLLSNSPPSPAILHIHGGGMIIRHMDQQLRLPRLHAGTSHLPVFSIDYRVAPESPSPTPLEDAYSALTFLHTHSQLLHIDPSKIAIVGESAGGGLAAGVSLLARDRNLQPPLAKQILIYPMLDDRTTTSTAIAPFATWSYADNLTAWSALLGKDTVGTDKVSPYSAPARAAGTIGLHGLPPTYIDVGGLDIFLHEDLEFAAQLAKAGVEVEVQVYPGVPHAFEMIAPGVEVTRRARENRARVMRGFYRSNDDGKTERSVL
ncbi:hypothetical protein H072_1928 [Dactylellina haptotyla CBS 200.50]|uniref:Alpha/beta hydrolase fold-3 domain-containing protein n=1 Tax=Dactylellina haptotyla (strain CBS 200.50) TaxID=1284197 RepID=S8C8R4_DACHA|nr:hypothetical protein H072_1928 [Dactylellina haptotyla CBS 200.50]